MGEIKASKRTSKKDGNNNEVPSKKFEKDVKCNVKTEIIGQATLIPTTINYNSNVLPDAIFLTTSNGQLITTPSINPAPPPAGTTSINDITTTTSSVTDSKHQMKKEKKHLQEEHGGAAAKKMKPSALKNSSANSRTTHSSLVTTPNKEQTIFATNFPLFTTGLPNNLAAVFSSQNNFTTGLTPITTFSLQNPLLTPNLTIPIYNSLVAVSGTAKDGLPTINKELFSPATSSAAKGNSKNKNSLSVITQNSANMTTARGRKRTAQSRLPAKLKEPAAVARRNARERRRVKMVNDGFLRLRRHVPTDPKNKKLSKVKTLRLAIEYIHHLQQLLHADSNAKQSVLVTGFTQVNNGYEEMDGGNVGWLNSESLARVNRDLEEDIFQTIDPARLRTNYTDYITR